MQLETVAYFVFYQRCCPIDGSCPDLIIRPDVTFPLKRPQIDLVFVDVVQKVTSLAVLENKICLLWFSVAKYCIYHIKQHNLTFPMGGDENIPLAFSFNTCGEKLFSLNLPQVS